MLTIAPNQIVRILILVSLLMCTSVGIFAATVTHTQWGRDKDGTPVELYILSVGAAEVRIATYGARIVSIRVPDRDGHVANVVLGYDVLDPYLETRSVKGATIGRYANRIAKGQFTLNGTAYQVPVGRDGNALHGGPVGFDRKVWQAKQIKDGVEMSLKSPDGDMGFPGDLTLHVAFTLLQQKGGYAVRLVYTATTDKTTVVNFTNHAYFNLSGDPATPVLKDLARINANMFTPVDSTGIPTGVLEPVVGTALDFRAAHAIGERIPEHGYDNNLVLAHTDDKIPVAEVDDPASGRTMQVFTSEPAMQFFVPLPSASAPGQSGQNSPATAAFCLETQHFPDSPNHPNFPSTTLQLGASLRSTTTYVFGVSQVPIIQR
jgi:aldose 1-epimerase